MSNSNALAKLTDAGLVSFADQQDFGLSARFVFRSKSLSGDVGGISGSTALSVGNDKPVVRDWSWAVDRELVAKPVPQVF